MQLLLASSSFFSPFPSRPSVWRDKLCDIVSARTMRADLNRCRHYGQCFISVSSYSFHGPSGPNNLPYKKAELQNPPKASSIARCMLPCVHIRSSICPLRRADLEARTARKANLLRRGHKTHPLHAERTSSTTPPATPQPLRVRPTGSSTDCTGGSPFSRQRPPALIVLSRFGAAAHAAHRTYASVSARAEEVRLLFRATGPGAPETPAGNPCHSSRLAVRARARSPTDGRERTGES